MDFEFTDEELLAAGLDHLGVPGPERQEMLQALAAKIRGWRAQREPLPKLRVLPSACPFCGGWLGSVLVEHGEGCVTGLPRTTYTVICGSCAARGPWQKSESGALRWWGTREAPDLRDPEALLADVPRKP